MSYQVFRINNNTFERINEITNIKSFSWSDSLDKIFTSFNFTTTEILECGDWIELRHREDNILVLRGIIFTTRRSDRNFYTYSGYDIGVYFEKNMLNEQFRKNTTLGNAIIRVCNDVQLSIGRLHSVVQNQQILGFFRNKSGSDILKDVYKSAVNNGMEDVYCFDCKNGTVNFRSFIENNTFRGVIANIFQINSFDFFREFEISHSIDELKNRVQIYPNKTANKNTLPKMITQLSNADSINRYGLLNYIEEVKTDKKINYSDLAHKKLQELNKVKENISLSILGDYTLQKGTITNITNNILNLDNSYRIDSTEHSIQGTTENVKINITQFELER